MTIARARDLGLIAKEPISGEWIPGPAYKPDGIPASLNGASPGGGDAPRVAPEVPERKEDPVPCQNGAMRGLLLEVAQTLIGHGEVELARRTLEAV